MRILLIISLTILCGGSLMSQNMEQRIRQEKAKYLNEKMALSDDQKESFWELYDEFQIKRRDIRIEITQNRLGLQKSTVTENDAKKIIDRELELKQSLVNLEIETVKKYESVLTSLQIVQLYKAEDDFNKVVMKRLRQMRGNQGNQRNRPRN